MSLIIAAVDGDGRIYMGCDSWITAGDNRCHITQNKIKVINLTPGFIVGAVGDLRFIQLAHSFNPPRNTFKRLCAYDYLTKKWIPKFRKYLKKEGYIREDDGEKVIWNILIGFKSEIFYIVSDFAVMQFPDGIYAIGAGENETRVLWPNLPDWGIPSKMMKCFETIGEIYNTVGPPYIIKAIDRKGKECPVPKPMTKYQF